MQSVSISVYNQAKSKLSVPLNVLVPALQVYVDIFVKPIWNTPAKLTLTDGPVTDTWSMVFLDNADQPGALAYHTLDGLPIAKIFVETIVQNNETLSSAASHELVEMLVDPSCSLLVQGSTNSNLYAVEAADPVEETTFQVNDLPMSNFVYPSYFQPYYAKSSTLGFYVYDHCHELKSPVGTADSIAAGGYQSYIQPNGQWAQTYGSTNKEKRFAKEDRRGHRSEYRKSMTF